MLGEHFRHWDMALLDLKFVTTVFSDLCTLLFPKSSIGECIWRTIQNLNLNSEFQSSILNLDSLENLEGCFLYFDSRLRPKLFWTPLLIDYGKIGTNSDN